MFTNRHEAGKILAERLEDLGSNLVVLALPRGGVPVALEIAERLGAPLDMLFIKKIGFPGHLEFALGAVSEVGTFWNQPAVTELNIDEVSLHQLEEKKKKEVLQQLQKWRRGRPASEVKGKTAIVVDDGLATGSSMQAALTALRQQTPAKIVVAVPVASRAAVLAIQKMCDEVVVLETPEFFSSVGEWYEDFTQVSDQDVERILERKSNTPAFR